MGETLVTQVLMERPENPVPFMIRWLAQQTNAPSSILEAGEAEKLRTEIESLQSEVKDLEEKLKAVQSAQGAAIAEAGVAEAGVAEDGAWKLSPEQRAKYEALLKPVPMLEHLDANQLSRFADEMKEETFQPDAEVVVQGAPGERFYIVESGALKARKAGEAGEDGVANEVNVMEYKPGDYFGDLALMRDNTPYPTTVTAITEVTVISIDPKGLPFPLKSS